MMKVVGEVTSDNASACHVRIGVGGRMLIRLQKKEDPTVVRTRDNTICNRML